jgi:hypothetical protein
VPSYDPIEESDEFPVVVARHGLSDYRPPLSVAKSADRAVPDRIVSPFLGKLDYAQSSA